MEIIFSAVIVTLSLLFYLSNRAGHINRWCAIYLSIASVGVVKEAFLYQVIPWIQSVWGNVIREDVYAGVYSVLTWVAYSFTFPAALIMGLYFYGLNHTKPKLMSVIKGIVWIPAAALSLIYTPLSFRTRQLEGGMFWVVYSIYSVVLGAAVIYFILRGIGIEKSPTVKRQKIVLAAGVLPPSVYVLITIFVIHSLGIAKWFKVWQWNVIIVFISLVLFVVTAFKNGFMGVKLSAQIFEWDTDMDLVGKGADYTSHMLKNQTSKMELCIEQLKIQLAPDDNQELPEEIAILSRSISTLKNYIDRMKRHSQTIRLLEETCSLPELIAEAMPVSLRDPQSRIRVHIDLPEQVVWICDKNHMTEVFANVLTNAAEAIRESGSISITGAFGNPERNFLLSITDTGIGMNEYDLNNIFTPYFTTKSTEKNFGLGLSYCKNVLTKHGGNISASSKPGKGTKITIAFPARKVAMSNDGVGAVNV